MKIYVEIIFQSKPSVVELQMQFPAPRVLIHLHLHLYVKYLFDFFRIVSIF